MDNIISVIGFIWIGFSFLGVILYELAKLVYMTAHKCFKHQKKIDLSEFTTGTFIVQDGSCSAECIFSKNCNRHKADRGGLTPEETESLLHYVDRLKKGDTKT